MGDEPKVTKALSYAARYGSADGAHHKAWVIDQMVRALTGCPEEEKRYMSPDGSGGVVCYSAMTQGESDEYRQWVAAVREGEDGPDTYGWEKGVAP